MHAAPTMLAKRYAVQASFVALINAC